MKNKAHQLFFTSFFPVTCICPILKPLTNEITTKMSVISYFDVWGISWVFKQINQVHYNYNSTKRYDSRTCQILWIDYNRKIFKKYHHVYKVAPTRKYSIIMVVDFVGQIKATNNIHSSFCFSLKFYLGLLGKN